MTFKDISTTKVPNRYRTESDSDRPPTVSYRPGNGPGSILDMKYPAGPGTGKHNSYRNDERVY